MKNIKTTLFMSVVSGMILTGCNDLDTEPWGNTVTSDQKEQVVEKDPSMVKASVTAIASMFNVYAGALPNSFGHEDYGFGSIMMLMESRGQDMVSVNTGYNWYTRSVVYSDVTKESRSTYLVWNTIYPQIYSANAVTKTIDPATEDPTLQFYLAQALAMRAFDYFTLAQIYQHHYKGNESKPCVPLITEQNADEAAVNGCARATVDEVYTQVLKDLTDAITLLEASGMVREDNRYVSKEVAYGLRARVNLTMENWTDAAADAQKALGGGASPYTLDEVRGPGFQDIEDWMWGVFISETDPVVTSGIVNFSSHMGSLNYGYASVGAWRRVSKALYEAIPETDVRKGWFLDENAQSADLNAKEVAQAAKYGCPPYCQMKFAPYQDVMGQSVNACDIPLMRAEEMYLILAEAQAMGGNAAEGAKTLENFVKTYRDPAYVCKAATSKEVQDAVWFQRRVELWGEGLPWYDLLRLGKGVDRRGAGFEAAYVFHIPAGDDALIYRLPKSEEEGNTLISAEDNNPAVSIPTPVADN